MLGGLAGSRAVNSSGCRPSASLGVIGGRIVSTGKIIGDPSRSRRGAPPAPLPAPGDPPDRSPFPTPPPARARQHVYRVGALKIPVKNPGLIQAPRSRFARKYKEILHKMERPKKPDEARVDLDAIEPPIRSRPAPRENPPPPRREPPMRRSELDRDVEDDGDED